MNAFIDHARRAIDAVFEHLGAAAAYTPPGGGAAVPCIIIDGRTDREFTGFSGRPLMEANIFRVRRSEIAAPAAGGVFVVDGTSFTILGDPRSDDPLRLEWVCTVECTREERRTAFEAALEAIDDAIAADRTLGGAVDRAAIRTPRRAGNGLITDGMPNVLAAEITAVLGFTSSRPF